MHIKRSTTTMARACTKIFTDIYNPASLIAVVKLTLQNTAMYAAIAVCTPPTCKGLLDWMLIIGEVDHDVIAFSGTPLCQFKWTVKRVGISSETFRGFRGAGKPPSCQRKGRTATKGIAFDVKTWLWTETAARWCQDVFIFIFRLLLKPLDAAEASEREIIRGRMCRDVRIWSCDVKIRGQFRYRAKSFLNSMFWISQLDAHGALSFCRVYVIDVCLSANPLYGYLAHVK